MKNRWDESVDLRANLRKRLPKLARKYLESGDDALLTEKEWEEVHDFRLATKRFRYTLEIFEGLYGPGMRQRLDDLRKIQKLLGEANDLIVTAGLLESIPETEALRAEFTARAGRKLKRLRAWWRTTFESGPARKRWCRYLASVQIPIGPANEQVLGEDAHGTAPPG